MSRIVKKPEVRRQELINIALKQFIINGYDKTSIRSIIEEAGGEIGMFYHYFDSKHEIFEEVLEQYQSDFIKKFQQILNKTEGFEEKVKEVLEALIISRNAHNTIYSDKMDFAMMAVLQNYLLLKLTPLLELLIIDGLKQKKLKTPVKDTHALSSFLLSGISTILNEPKSSNESKRASNKEKWLSIKILVNKIVGYNILPDHVLPD